MGTRIYGISLALFLTCTSLMGQTVSKGDSLARQCRFEDAINAYLAVSRTGMSKADEAALERKIAASEKAISMADFCAEPTVVARRRFSRKDFFLYYPLKPHAWREGPGGIVYMPKGSRTLFYSAPDKAGTKSLFMTRDLDSIWMAPRMLGEAFLSIGNEIYPMLSRDGKTLWFASDGLSGMGGYDIYSSAWDEEAQRWGDPVNMGFPFNSPADDFLMADSDDGKYTLFASNRDCGKDSVDVYVLDYEKNPSRKGFRSPADLQKLLALNPVDDPSRIDNAAAVDGFSSGNSVTQRYMRKMQESRALMDSISRHMAPGDTLLAVFRSRLALVSAELREIELSFLMSGAVAFEEDKEVVGAELGYTFARGSLGPGIKLKMGSVPSGESYRIAPVGRIVADNTLPPGLVFQILLFDSPTHAMEEDLCGLTPVYERLGSNLRYGYYVGLFPSYQDALANLNVIRLLGFPGARIVAWRDGIPIQRIY